MRCMSKPAPTFDTLKLVRHFEKNGFDARQAEAIVDAMRDVSSSLYVAAISPACPVA